MPLLQLFTLRAGRGSFAESSIYLLFDFAGTRRYPSLALCDEKLIDYTRRRNRAARKNNKLSASPRPRSVDGRREGWFVNSVFGRNVGWSRATGAPDERTGRDDYIRLDVHRSSVNICRFRKIHRRSSSSVINPTRLRPNRKTNTPPPRAPGKITIVGEGCFRSPARVTRPWPVRGRQKRNLVGRGSHISALASS